MPCDFCMGRNSMFIVNIDMICELQMKLTNQNALQPIIILNIHLKVCIWLSSVKMYCSKFLMEDRSKYVWSDFKCWPIKTSNIQCPVLICSHVVICGVNSGLLHIVDQQSGWALSALSLVVDFHLWRSKLNQITE